MLENHRAAHSSTVCDLLGVTWACLCEPAQSYTTNRRLIPTVKRHHEAIWRIYRFNCRLIYRLRLLIALSINSAWGVRQRYFKLWNKQNKKKQLLHINQINWRCLISVLDVITADSLLINKLINLAAGSMVTHRSAFGTDQLVIRWRWHPSSPSSFLSLLRGGWEKKSKRHLSQRNVQLALRRYTWSFISIKHGYRSIPVTVAWDNVWNLQEGFKLIHNHIQRRGVSFNQADGLSFTYVHLLHIIK